MRSPSSLRLIMPILFGPVVSTVGHAGVAPADRAAVVPDPEPRALTVSWRAVPADPRPAFGQYRIAVADTPASNIQLDHVWARPTIGGSKTGAVYFTVTAASQPDRLMSTSTPVAASASLHETIDDNGVMKMRPVPPIDLTPGKPVTFSPGGYHVMLMGLKTPLKAGDSFPLTLTFEHAPQMTVTVPVEAAGGGMGSGGHDMGNMNNMPGMHGQ